MNNNPHSKETKKKMSSTKKSLWADPLFKKNMSEALIGRTFKRDEAASRKRAISVYGFYWGDRDFGTDKELQHFKGCHNRVREGKSPSIFWQRNIEGFREFLDEIGNIPKGMEKPSVGRIDHSKGYEPNNIQWEEHKLNSIKRKGTRYETARN